MCVCARAPLLSCDCGCVCCVFVSGRDGWGKYQVVQDHAIVLAQLPLQSPLGQKFYAYSACYIQVGGHAKWGVVKDKR